jgi:hypothetical protein
LALRWQKKLLVHAWRLLRDEEAAKDAVQDSWAEIVRGVRQLRDERALALGPTGSSPGVAPVRSAERAKAAPG